MTRLGLRGRIAITAVAATASALVVVLLLMGPDLRRRTIEHAQETMLAEARLMAHVVAGPLARRASVAELDALVDGAGRLLNARVTIIGLDGRVLADTDVSGSALLQVENHGGRPEVRAVLATGAGSAARHSATVGRDLLYAAVPIRHDGHLIGISRVAYPLSAVNQQVVGLRRSVLLALFAAFAVIALLAGPLAASVARPLRGVTDAARRFAAGDLEARALTRGPTEVRELARILNQSADQLAGRLVEVSRERARVESILSAMQSGLLAVDHRGTVVLANDDLRRSLGLSDPVGRHYLEVIRLTELSRIVEQVLRSGAPCAVEVRLTHLRRTFAVAAAPFPGPARLPHGAVVTFEDVTERRRADEIRRDFVANASHELRTPLTSIRGFVEALEDGALSDPPVAHRFLEKIRTHADRMASLVSDLLELSRLEAGERAPQWEAVQPAEMVEDVVASFAELARARSIVLAWSADGAPGLVTDPDRLRRILENLVENAVKYTPEGGRVEVSARPAGSAVHFEVRDNGAGIAPEHLPRIFERFYRVDKARSREMGGTGLGLSIVKHLAESIGATVSVQSEPARGSRFEIALPRQPPGRAAQPQP